MRRRAPYQARRVMRARSGRSRTRVISQQADRAETVTRAHRQIKCCCAAAAEHSRRCFEPSLSQLSPFTAKAGTRRQYRGRVTGTLVNTTA